MKKLRQNTEVVVYHDVDDEGNHSYYFYDEDEKVDLDWGEVGHIPNRDDRFPHPDKNLDLRLDNILWADDC